MIQEVVDEYRLEEIADHHVVNAGSFVPFVIGRLQGNSNELSAILRVRLLDIDQPGERERSLRLTWSPESVPKQPFAVQDRSVTEWAACGVACAVVKCCAGLKVHHIAKEGEGFDYWVRDDKRDYGLEVSGTMTEDVNARHREKVRQLQQGPAGVGGFVVIVGFATRTVIFSFHPSGELTL